MPIFEYRCENCEEVFERIVFSGEEGDIHCPKCRGAKVKKLMSASSFMGTDGMGKCAGGAPKGFS